jgi:hypothetical protein
MKIYSYTCNETHPCVWNSTYYHNIIVDCFCIWLTGIQELPLMETHFMNSINVDFMSFIFRIRAARWNMIAANIYLAWRLSKIMKINYLFSALSYFFQVKICLVDLCAECNTLQKIWVRAAVPAHEDLETSQDNVVEAFYVSLVRIPI